MCLLYGGERQAGLHRLFITPRQVYSWVTVCNNLCVTPVVDIYQYIAAPAQVTKGPLVSTSAACALSACHVGETVPGTGEVARFPEETLGTHKMGSQSN